MQETSSAIIVAAGTSSRMQGRDKLWTPLAGRLTLARTIDVFEGSPIVDRIILVLNFERLSDATTLCAQEGWQKIAALVPGGQRRQDSVCAGLDALATIAPACQWVMIPFPSHSSIKRTTAARRNAMLPMMPPYWSSLDKR
ncbi:MAG: hypothetical protein E6I91_00755 [Chloroflexi bacterium]|nr:MAG: hypothetical protein E6I91_00755 [Chloroflexota bacterium]